MTEPEQGTDVRRRAGWMPGRQEDLEDWLADLSATVDAKGEQVPLHPTLVALADLVDGDPLLRMYAERMITQQPARKPYSQPYLRDLPHLLRLVNEVLGLAPEFSTDSMVMTPIAAVLDWPVDTPAGFAFFRDPRVNAALAEVLHAWCDFLSGPGSRYVLTDAPSGWLGEQARQTVGFEQYVHDPDAEHAGFASWNDFFTRRFVEGERPVAGPDDPTVIVSACESTPYAINRNVAARDRYWAKDQSYSLHDLLDGDELTDRFVGGTVYQAFLSATDYHRWHAPVSGTVVRATVVPGTYFSEADTQGGDAAEPQQSQGYLAHVATRAVIIIEADEPAIGLVAFVPIGMSDVSSCVLGPDLGPGTHVDKGAELGMFQFGGSTHCLVFQPDVIADFAFPAIPQSDDPDAPLVHVRSRIATATRR